jgi:hypothetical protein
MHLNRRFSRLVFHPFSWRDLSLVLTPLNIHRFQRASSSFLFLHSCTLFFSRGTHHLLTLPATASLTSLDIHFDYHPYDSGCIPDLLPFLHHNRGITSLQLDLPPNPKPMHIQPLCQILATMKLTRLTLRQPRIAFVDQDWYLNMIFLFEQLPLCIRARHVTLMLNPIDHPVADDLWTHLHADSLVSNCVPRFHTNIPATMRELHLDQALLLEPIRWSALRHLSLLQCSLSVALMTSLNFCPLEDLILIQCRLTDEMMYAFDPSFLHILLIEYANLTNPFYFLCHTLSCRILRLRYLSMSDSDLALLKECLHLPRHK